MKSRKGFYLFGLDISLKNTGVAIYDLEKKEFVYIGSFNTEGIRATREYKNLDATSVKLHKISEWFEDLIEQYPPYFASIEQMVKVDRKIDGKNIGVNINEVKGIAKATGVIQEHLWNVPTSFYYPSEVKAVIAKGNASKEVVQNTILHYFPELKFANFDESDATALALTQLINVGIIEWDKPTPPKKKTTKRKKE
ncbi:MAG: crossover junction endodeoxyribonuclease RuvC [Psychrobacillus sp.]